MNYKNFLKSLPEDEAAVSFDEDLKAHCSFKIGGIAKYFVIAHNSKILIEILQKTKKYFLLGAGTNVLFRDKKYRGTILKLGEEFKEIKIKKRNKDNIIVEAGAAVNLFSLNKFLRENKIGGLEWSFGIPGSVGGAVTMNAGAFGSEFGDSVLAVKILGKSEAVWTKKFSFSYRNSSFKNTNCIILAVRLKLKTKPAKEIEELQMQYFSHRKNTQPYGESSAGSVFKRINIGDEIFYPSKIIDNLGLKGVKIGGAEISRKHAGFIINSGNAQANDVIKLIRLVKGKVKSAAGQELKEEIVIL